MADKGMSMASVEDEKRIGKNYGHGHVWLRPDGVRIRCGGAGLCSKCSRDAAMVKAFNARKTPAMTDTQTEAATGAAILKEMVDGLEGVTPGKWRSRGMGGDSYVLSDTHKWHRPSSQGMGYPLAIPRRDDNPKELIDYWSAGFAHRDAAHIARCCPDSIRAIATYVEALEAENKELKHDIGRHIQITSNQATEISLLHEALRRYGDWPRMATVEPQELQQAIDRAHSAASTRAALQGKAKP